MTYIQAVFTALPQFPLEQERVRQLARELLRGKVPFLEDAVQLFANSGVQHRRLVRSLDEIIACDSLGQRNQIYSQACVQLGSQLLEQLFASGQVQPSEIDLIITTSCTGFMIPSVDAHLINVFPFRSDIKRLPITELGCAAGAIGLSRAADYLRAFPLHRVILLALEFPSLTYRTKDFRVANLVSCALFGDGGALALLGGQSGPARILANRSHFFPNSLDMMGFDLDESGFKIILDKRISQLLENDFLPVVEHFLHTLGWNLDDLQHHLFHPGGRKIMDTLEVLLRLPPHALRLSRAVLAEVGNLSSASVLWVLARALAEHASGKALLAAFGPGFNAELLALQLEPFPNI